MKKIIFLFTLVIAIALISGYKQSAQNELAGRYLKPATPKDFKGIDKPDVREFKADIGPFTPKKTSEVRPRILFMLSNDKGKVAWSNSLWWSYEQTNNEQPGC